jgi:hypothetical protein
MLNGRMNDGAGGVDDADDAGDTGDKDAAAWFIMF